MAGSRLRDCANAAMDALVADSTLSTLLGGAKAYSHVPEGTDPPYVRAWSGLEVPWAEVFDATGDDGARAVEVHAECVSTYRGTKEVDNVADRVLEVLTTASTWASVTGFSLVQFVSITAPAVVDLNGVLWWARTVTVRVYLTA